MVYQHFGLFDHRTVLANVEYGLEIRQMDKKERREIAMEYIELVGLKGYEDQYPGQLSGGMQQRVGLARALTNNPDILLMGEPFSVHSIHLSAEKCSQSSFVSKNIYKKQLFLLHMM